MKEIIIIYENSPLYHAPHTAESLLTEEWTKPYSREQAAFPTKTLRDNKYWPPVGRVDNVHGDKNLICACLPIEAYED
jgi:glycine dehydrogenase